MACIGLVMLAGAASTGNADTVAPALQGVRENLLKAIAPSQKLVVGSDIAANYKPFEFFAEDGLTPQGFDIDLAREIGAKLGMEVEFAAIGFDGLIAALSSDRVHFVASSVTDTKARQEKVDFVDYVLTRQGVLQRADDERVISRMEDLCGLHMVKLNGGASIGFFQRYSTSCVEKGAAPLEITTFDSTNESQLAVRTGRVDAFIENMTMLNPVVDNVAGFKLNVLEDYPANRIGIAVAKGDATILKAVRAALSELHADGTYGKLLEKWDLSHAAIDNITINDAQM